MDAAGGRLFIADSAHHRVVATDLSGRFLFSVGGDGGPGLVDGSFDAAAFRSPQGLAYDAAADALLVADTENHALRRIDLKSKRVSTLAGDGVRGKDYKGGGSGAAQRLNSPWDVAMLPGGGGDALVALAGTHQLWRYEGSSSGALRVFSGDGYERNTNGPDGANTSWAQPSGLSLSPSGDVAYVADAESSSVRACDTRTGGARLLAGGDALYADNLFRFGDADGAGTQVRLQHPLAVAASPDGSTVYFADSYNHKLKALSLPSGAVRTLAGSGVAGLRDGVGAAAQLAEPSGLALGPGGEELFVADTNNGAVRVLNLASGALRTLDVSSVPLPPKRAPTDAAAAAAAAAGAPPPALEGAAVVRADAGAVGAGAARGTLALLLTLPSGYHFTQGAGSAFAAEVFPPAAASIAAPSAGPLATRAGAPAARVAFSRAPGAPAGLLRVTCRVYFCEDEAVCLFQGVVFEAQLPPAGTGDGGAAADVALSFAVSPRAPRAGPAALPSL
jgi:DNA-binding beta-propeller fold protein YncE